MKMPSPAPLMYTVIRRLLPCDPAAVPLYPLFVPPNLPDDLHFTRVAARALEEDRSDALVLQEADAWHTSSVQVQSLYWAREMAAFLQRKNGKTDATALGFTPSQTDGTGTRGVIRSGVPAGDAPAGAVLWYMIIQSCLRFRPIKTLLVLVKKECRSKSVSNMGSGDHPFHLHTPTVPSPTHPCVAWCCAGWSG